MENRYRSIRILWYPQNRMTCTDHRLPVTPAKLALYGFVFKDLEFIRQNASADMQYFKTDNLIFPVIINNDARLYLFGFKYDVIIQSKEQCIIFFIPFQFHIMPFFLICDRKKL